MNRIKQICKERAGGVYGAMLAFAASSVMVTALFCAPQIAKGVQSGLRLCGTVIIPSVFPFMILSDLICHSYESFRFGIAGRIFEKIFHVPASAIPAFLIGCLCGFPLGVRATISLYNQNILTKNEAETMIGFCNNTGPAFVIAGIGAGIRGSQAEGGMLYAATVLSAVAVGILFRPRSVPTAKAVIKKGGVPRWSLPSSVTSAGLGMLYVCSFVVLFSAITSLLSLWIHSPLLLSSLLSLLEVSNAAKLLGTSGLLYSPISLPLTAFAVGSSGLSVHLQSLSLLSDGALSARKYFRMKVTQGIIAALLVALMRPVLY